MWCKPSIVMPYDKRPTYPILAQVKGNNVYKAEHSFTKELRESPQDSQLAGVQRA